MDNLNISMFKVKNNQDSIIENNDDDYEEDTVEGFLGKLTLNDYKKSENPYLNFIQKNNVTTRIHNNIYSYCKENNILFEEIDTHIKFTFSYEEWFSQEPEIVEDEIIFYLTNYACLCEEHVRCFKELAIKYELYKVTNFFKVNSNKINNIIDMNSKNFNNEDR